ncbi:MAG: DUF2075 domain-containing protein [Verrucomicrobia bacterium]|nr:DUF2075 domain-containing protein [Verrucomicrobiota bacterium]
MLLTVSEFRSRVADALPALVCQLQETTGRQNPDEAKAWESSLPKVSKAFDSPAFQPLHLYFGARGKLTLEYRLPASSCWCDMVLLGAHQGEPAAVIVELKDWMTRSDKPGPCEGLMMRHTGATLHPSDQVRGYTEYCRRFHSTVLDSQANVHGCVLFTRETYFGTYKLPPNEELASEFPCFSATNGEADPLLVDFIKTRLTVTDESFANEFETGSYRQDRNFVRQMAEQVKDASGGPFELLDGQRLGLALCRSEIEKAIFRDDGIVQKTVIIIDGPPGSGKSVLAGKLWASLATDDRITSGNFVVTTTSKAQESNWQYIFKQIARARGGAGVVMAANKYAPETIPGLGRWMNQYPGKFTDPMDWRKHCKLISKLRGGSWMPDDQMLVSVVDEAHALMNPEHSDARTQAGWPVNLGPQAYHVIRGSVVSIFLLDSQQSFRERESTTIDDIISWAKEQGASVPPVISLTGEQFRCAGSREYVEWVDDVCAGADVDMCAEKAKPWSDHYEPESTDAWSVAAEQYTPNGDPLPHLSKLGKLEFRVFDTPFEMEAALRERLKANETARLVSPFARKWITKGIAEPHDLPADMVDFNFDINFGEEKKSWARPWNVIPNGNDYTHFIQGPPSSRINNDPLAEVGCTYVVRGFDFDYIGLLWLSDLKWRDGQWKVFPKEVHETGLTRSLQRARRETDDNGPDHQALLKKVLQSYRILLTRALKGVYIWFEDKQTQEHIRACIGQY